MQTREKNFWLVMTGYSLVVIFSFMVCLTSFGLKSTILGFVTFFSSCTLGVLALWLREELTFQAPVPADIEITLD